MFFVVCVSLLIHVVANLTNIYQLQYFYRFNATSCLQKYFCSWKRLYSTNYL